MKKVVSDPWVNVMIETEIIGVSPGEDEKDADEHVHGIHSRRSGEQGDGVEEHSTQRGESSEESEDQQDADQEFGYGEHLGDPTGVGYDEVVQECGPPPIGRTRTFAGCRFGTGFCCVPLHADPVVVPECGMLRAPELLVSSIEPLVAQPEASDKPQDARHVGAEQSVGEPEVA